VDFTIADFVADLRAATPSNAAELVVPHHAEHEAKLREAHTRLLRAGKRSLAEARLRLEQHQERSASALKQLIARRRRALDEQHKRLAALHPRARLHRDRAALQALRTRLEARVRQEIDRRRRAFVQAAGKLDAMSPLKVLERGYSLTRNAAGHVLTDARETAVGETVNVRLLRGELELVVQSIRPDSSDEPKAGDEPGPDGGERG
jgi:exodeoxyribonuclease VII large subunit